MSRRGRDNHWSRAKMPRPRPRGLRGKDIGLYYKSQQVNRMPREEPIVQFTMPPAVISALQNNLKTVEEKAKAWNIPITKFSGLKLSGRQPSELPSSTPTDQFEDSQTFGGPCTSTYSYFGESACSQILTKAVENIMPKPLEGHTALDKPSTSGCSSSEELGPEDVTMEGTNQRINDMLLTHTGDFKYGYEDIITGTFDEKLEECLARDDMIVTQNSESDDLCMALFQDYKDMLNMSEYKKMKEFREKLPAYKKAQELLDMISNNQVAVISGETGCGKSTQVPQIILDDAIRNNKGAYVKILVTQPRRIAASSLAMRVAEERAEELGGSVGYVVRLEKVDARPRGSIVFCTTGVLLATLEVDQALSNYTHIILDEVHERDCDIDLAMYMLKKILKKRRDLKLILMSATIDADTLSEYFDQCPMMHIEGLAYPVQDIYLEDILELTKYKLPPQLPKPNKVKPWHTHKKKRLAHEMEKDIQYKAEIGPWLESIKGQLHPDVYKTLQDQRLEEINFDLIMCVLEYICQGPAGAVLIFVPGIADISKLIKTLKDNPNFPHTRYEVHPLHSKVASVLQHKIFDKPQGNKRKIIIATNIAETSITINDIVYVIDSGLMKHKGLNVEQNISTLQTEWISQANLRQRRGRAGRCQPGICYHLFTTYRASKLEERPLPEIQRNPLLEPVLTIKRLRLGLAADALQQLPAPPALSTIKAAVKHLQLCGALNYAEKLTPLGWHLARLPVHPAAGKLLLLGALFGCLDRAASVAAVWGFKEPFQLVIGKENEAEEAKIHFALGEGSDQVAISEAIIQWENQQLTTEKRHFAYVNYLSYNTLELLCEMKGHFRLILRKMGFLSGDKNSHWEDRNRDNLSLFKAVVAAALYPNVANAKWSNLHRNTKIARVKGWTAEDGYIYLHPSSVMAFKQPPKHVFNRPAPSACYNPGAPWLVYWQKQRSTDLFLHEITLINTLPLLFFGELTVTEAVNDDDCYIKMTSAKVLCKRTTTELVFQLRSLLDQVLASRIQTSCSTRDPEGSPFEEHVLNAVSELITAEDERLDSLRDDDDDSGPEFSSGEPNTWRR